MKISRDDLAKKIQDALIEGKLSCATAHRLAAEYDVELAEIGKLANELKIKINKCQLGCF